MLDAQLLELTVRSAWLRLRSDAMAEKRKDDTISPDEFISPSFWSVSTLLMPFTLVKDAAGWVRDAIKQCGLPD